MRSCAIARCRGFRNEALPGVSGMTIQAKTATMMLGNPSTRKRVRQGAIGPLSLTRTMSQARLLAKDEARGAAEMKRPFRKASSSRL